jgi:acyl-CoA thioesterase FadM
VNRLVRLLVVWLRARRHRGPGTPLDEWRTALRVMPNDLDLLRHMNNGSYLTLMDIGRVDMLVRSGAQREVDRRRWYPVVVGESIRFRRSLELWDRFVIVTSVIGWDERVIFLEQRFERARGAETPEIVAEAWVAARFIARAGGTVASPDVAVAFGLAPASPLVPEAVLAWARALDLAHRPRD